ncbi:phosphotransferase family protein [Piscinibacter sp.]|uniref:phosphotransferase family protein n=1 Tax=Piscinibacter sp. TaxID=1903157 RepID=UPI002BC26AD7|nr:aminoglycoside 3'-phosphotransferase/choline kinase family protein [Albitalea sp.]HUG26472.1 aminoglycoside 3'-phosphotransferase/choline kinase family protein [Albitalea sp.]
MAASPELPADPGVADFDALQEDSARWIGVVTALGTRYSSAPAAPAGEGTVLVALLGRELVLKLYPPFLRDHFGFERAMLGHLEGRLSLPTPSLVDSAEHAGWPYLVMSQLPGTPLDRVWPTLQQHERCEVLRTIGRLAAEVHALPLGPMPALAPRWADFLQVQRERCHGRQQRTGLPAHLLAQLESFLHGPVPEGPDVILTGEYTPFNLMHQDSGLSSMFDFGDGLVGPREYDWLGPLCFLAAGDAARIDAPFDGYHGRPFDRGRREALLRLILLHRYSNLKAQSHGQCR